MQFSAIWGMLADLWLAIMISFKPTTLAVFKDPTLLIRPSALSRLFMANIWEQYGPGTDQNARGEKEKLIRPYASGVVVDAGAGKLFVVSEFFREL